MSFLKIVGTVEGERAREGSETRRAAYMHQWQILKRHAWKR